MQAPIGRASGDQGVEGTSRDQGVEGTSRDQGVEPIKLLQVRL